MTPLPAARPSAFTTQGPSSLRTYSSQGSCSVKERQAAVGTPARAMTCLANFLEPSMRAAEASGPKHAIPAERTASATPSTSGASGPMTTRSMPFSRAKLATSTGEFWSIAATSAMVSMPPLPGATQSLPARGDSASLTRSACSRPPAPRRRISTLDSPTCPPSFLAMA